MTSLQDHARSIWQAGVDAVRAEPLVRRVVRIEHGELMIGDHRWTRSEFDRIVVIGAGKAATAMTQGLVASIGSWLPISGWVNVPADTVPAGDAIDNIHVHAARPAGVNEPTEQGVRGTQQILKLAAECSPRDLCIALISGGGSALLPAPANGITLSDKQAVTRFLSAAGADIAQLNTVRKHLSQVKGGGLLRACTAGELVTLVLSDVLGDPLDLIASGPTVPDSSSAEDALSVLSQYDPERTLPGRIYNVLAQESSSESSGVSTPTVKSTALILGNNAVAVDHATTTAASLGYTSKTNSATSAEGLAEQVGRAMADEMLTALQDGAVKCWISGGEPTVELAAAEDRGRGGRNQQLVLAAYQHLLAAQLTDQQWDRIIILSGGTDGEDGPTDAAGAFVDAGVHTRAAALGLDVAEHLKRNDAYTFFQRCGGLIKTGPTGTNVCDIRVAIVV